MSENNEIKPGSSWSGAAVMAGAAIGSAALAAALLYASKRKKKSTETPVLPHHTPETD